MKFEQLITFEIDDLIDSALGHLDTSLLKLNDDLKQKLSEDVVKDYEYLFDDILDKYYSDFNEFSLNKKEKFNEIIISFAKDNAKLIAKDLDNIDQGLNYNSNTYTKKYIEKRSTDDIFNTKTREVIVKVAYKQFKGVYITKANSILKDRSDFYRLNVKLRVDNALEQFKSDKEKQIHKKIDLESLLTKNDIDNQGIPKIFESKLSKNDNISNEINCDIEELFDILDNSSSNYEEDFNITLPLDNIDNMFEQLENLDNTNSVKVDVPTQQLMNIDIVEEGNSVPIQDDLVSDDAKEHYENIADDSFITEHTELSNVKVEIEKSQKKIGIKFITTLIETFILVILMLLVFYIFIEFIQ